jgi:predicted CoA-binding protein
LRQHPSRDCRTIAVVGLSAEWHRPSYFAAKYMQQHGYRIVPVNPRYRRQILGEPCYARLEDIPFRWTWSTCSASRPTCCRSPPQRGAIGAKCLWQQIGVANLRPTPGARAGAGQR